MKYSQENTYIMNIVFKFSYFRFNFHFGHHDFALLALANKNVTKKKCNFRFCSMLSRCLLYKLSVACDSK